MPDLQKSRSCTRVAMAMALAVTFAGGVLGPLPASASSLVVETVVLARGADDPLNPSGRTSNFGGVDTVFAVVRLDGRPKAGVLTGVFSFRGKEFARTSINVANSQEITPIAGDTFVTLTAAPSTGTKFPIGSSYRLRILLDGKVDGSVEFSVVPPKGAITTKVLGTRLVDAGGKARKIFAPNETATVQLVADFGLESWVEVQWTVNGKLDSEGTQLATITEAARGSRVVFSHKPARGWPKGKHSVLLVMDDQPVGDIFFTVR